MYLPNVFDEYTNREIYWDLLLTVVSGSLWFVVGVMVILTLINRTNRKFCIQVSMVTTYAVCSILKDSIREKRPELSCAKSNGFPSHHASYVGCLLGWLTLEMLFLKNDVLFKTDSEYKLWVVCFLVYAFLLVESRLYLGYHTENQVLWGIYVGIVVSSIVFFFVKKTTLNFSRPDVG